MTKNKQLILIPVSIAIGFAIGASIPSGTKTGEVLISALRFLRFISVILCIEVYSQDLF